MSVLSVAPELVSVAAGDLSGIGSAIAEANALASGSTLGVVAPAADSVSAELAALFGGHAQTYQTVSTQAEVFHEEFVSTLSRSSAAYAHAETESASGLGKGRAAGGLQVLGARQHQLTQCAGSRLWQPGRSPLWRSGMADPRLVTPRHGLPAGTRLWHPGVPGFKAHNVLAPRLFTPHNQLMGGQRGVFDHIAQNQISYLNTIESALQNFVHDEIAAIKALPGAFKQAWLDLREGNFEKAVNDVGKAFLHLFVNGYAGQGVYIDVPGYGQCYKYQFLGPLGDLAPILHIPAVMAQNLADFLKPLGFGYAGKAAQWLADQLQFVTSPFAMYKSIYATSFLMAPELALLFDVIGAPYLTVKAFENGIQSVFDAAMAGKPLVAVGDLLITPAKMAWASLFGEGTIAISSGTGAAQTWLVPVGGVVAPLRFASMTTTSNAPYTYGSGTMTGGLLWALVGLLGGGWRN